MMEKLRVAANSIVVKIIFGIIILAFIFTGVSGFFGSGPSTNDERLYIAKVDGEGINRQAFENEVQSTMKNAGSLMGGGDAFAKMIRQSVLSSLIDDHVAYNFSTSLGVKISDEQVKDMIRQQQFFFENGKFNNQRYLSLLAQNGFTPDSYAQILRTSIQKQQAINALILSDFSIPTDSEISALNNQTRTVYLTNFSIDDVHDDQLVVSDEEIENYYNDNAQHFKHQARVKMQYVVNAFPEIERDVNVTESEIKQYYNAKKEGVIVPQKQLFSVISYDSESAANKAYDSFSKMDVQDLANVKMDNIGWFSVNDTLPELLVKANLHKLVDFSKPIEQGGVYYIARLDKLDAEKLLPLDSVRNIIKAKLIKEKTQQIYDEQQAKLNEASSSSNMEQIAEQSGLELYKSSWNQEKEALSIGRFPAISDVAFSELMVKDGKPTGNISDLIYVPEYNSTFIIQVTDYEDEGISPLDEVKDVIHDHLLTNKKKELFTQKLNVVLAELNEKGSSNGIQFSKKFQLNRDTTNDEIDNKTVEEVVSVIPSVDAKRKYGASIIDDKHAQIFVITSVEEGDLTDISSDLKQERLQLEAKNLAEDLRSKVKIEIMPNANL